MAVTLTDEVRLAIASRLREWAESQFRTLSDCAKELDIAAQHLQIYLSSPDAEASLPSVPGGRLCVRLANAGLNLNWLMNGRGSMLYDSSAFISVVQAGDYLVVQATIPGKSVKNTNDT